MKNSSILNLDNSRDSQKKHIKVMQNLDSTFSKQASKSTLHNERFFKYKIKINFLKALHRHYTPHTIKLWNILKHATKVEK